MLKGNILPAMTPKVLIGTFSPFQLGPAISNNLWSRIAEIDELMPLCLEALLDFAVQHGWDSPEAEVVADITSGLQSSAFFQVVITSMLKVRHSLSIYSVLVVSWHNTTST